MPNHCENHTEIFGPKSEVQSIYDSMFSKEDIGELKFAISNLLPRPFNSATEEAFDWYHWSIENWGTKWGDYDHFYLPTKVDMKTNVNGNFGFIEIKYQTAWSPFHEEFWSKVSERYPNSLFKTTYFEQGMDFLGAIVAKNGYVCRDEDSIDFDWDFDSDDADTLDSQYQDFLDFVDNKLAEISADAEKSLFEHLNNGDLFNE